ncbi:MAG TPA: substrate-binding domain-containing protein [Tepidisphaeraceae bacterium]|nr:substrate-binding domain-containing protein [Tepidisphaeraceae bacterium]
MSRLALTLCVALAVLAGCKQKSTKTQIAVIPKGTTHEYWRSVNAGAEQAGKDLGVDIIWRGPLKEDDRAAQKQVVQQFVSNRVSGIVLAPLDNRGMVEPVQLATSQQIPVVIMDSALEGQVGKDFISFVATDNYKGGKMAGAELARLLDNKGKVVLLRYGEGSASTLDREKGFLDEIATHKDIVMLVSDKYAGATTDAAEKTALNMIDTIRQADGIFASNESATAGMLGALRTAGIAGKAKFVGFDATSALVDALKSKELNALVAQDPYNMGYQSVKIMVEHLQGKTVPERVDTGVHLITLDNLNSPEIQKLLNH